jgi:fatty acid synthase subunit alpha
LLGEKKVDRIIEIGPSNTLTSIARKTVDAKYREHDEALSITRQLLCCKNAENEIYYNIEFAEDTPKETATEETTSTEVIVEAEPVLLSVQSTGMQLSKAVSDAPVTAVEIVSTLVAKSLKKSTKNVSMDSTIKAVVGGLYLPEFPRNALIDLDTRSFHSRKRNHRGSPERVWLHA